MATLKLFNYEYGNYNDTRVKNITSLASEFPDESAVHIAENINVSFNDGLMTSLLILMITLLKILTMQRSQMMVSFALTMFLVTCTNERSISISLN